MSIYKVMGNFVYWDVPSATERDALVPTPAEKFKVCFQQSTLSLFLLTEANPPTWQEIGAMAGTEILTTRYDKVSNTVSYLGKASVGSSEAANVWRIQKITLDSPTTGDVEILYANGASTSVNSWASRASYSYS